MTELIKKNRAYRMNLLYIALQGCYWMMVCCTVSMGSAYLSNRGYSTFSIGLLFAIAYLFAAVLKPELENRNAFTLFTLFIVSRDS